VFRRVAHLFLITAYVAVIGVAFFRGNQLLGLDWGIVYAVIAFALLGLLTCSRTPAGDLSLGKVVFVVALALPVAYAMTFPASINPSVQVFIDKQANDRRIRADLAAVIGSDPAFDGLTVSSVHLKVVNVTVRGTLSTLSDFDRLRARITRECPALNDGGLLLHWDVIVQDSGQRISGLFSLPSGKTPN